MVNGTDVVGHQLSFGQIGGALQSYGKRVQSGPVGFCFRVVLDTHLAEFLGDGRDNTRVESTRQQHTVRHVAHQLALNGTFECVVDSLYRCGVVLHGIVLHPVALVVTLLSWVGTPVVMAGQERLVVLALALEGFQLRGYVHLSVGIATNVQWDNANWVASNQEFVGFFVVKGKGKDTAQIFQEVDTFFAIQCQDNLAVAARLEIVLTGIAATYLLMVVNLAVNGKHLFVVGREQGLTTRLWINNT